ncbi:hypothetical protein PAXRUDRAFT_822154 [Paxillus rubicundulus Ve08.2h10]|uniref:Uncharacterized protein n=1 Tax=Paxillus rubicundulus Ve08.2h10 TaxID=930991 RepID=A0A0D0EA50_9AGAM|nr:hypothetical protein PAXRUDRAFT_822154 [Paxillus rubicundulus Ve08.2h10]
MHRFFQEGTGKGAAGAGCNLWTYEHKFRRATTGSQMLPTPFFQRLVIDDCSDYGHMKRDDVPRASKRTFGGHMPAANFSVRKHIHNAIISLQEFTGIASALREYSMFVDVTGFYCAINNATSNRRCQCHQAQKHGGCRNKHMDQGKWGSTIERRLF